MQDPHLQPLRTNRQAETNYARIYLASNAQGDFALHVKLKNDHGFHEYETLEEFLGMEFCDACPLDGGEPERYWIALGKRESAGAVAVMEDTFERFEKNLDKVLIRTWDWRHSMKAIGKPHPLDAFES